MKFLGCLALLLFSVTTFAAPAVESYLPAAKAISAANDERANQFRAYISESRDLKDGSTEYTVVVKAFDEGVMFYAADTYLMVVKGLTEFKSIHFVGRELVK